MRSFARLVVLQMLRAYQWAISPFFPPACRYVPTCSEYAMEAVERYGVWRGGWKAAGRLLRCHPLARGGYDPVVGCLGSTIVAGRHASGEKLMRSSPVAGQDSFESTRVTVARSSAGYTHIA